MEFFTYIIHSLSFWCSCNCASSMLWLPCCVWLVLRNAFIAKQFNHINFVYFQCSEAFMHTRMRRRVESLIQVKPTDLFFFFLMSQSISTSWAFSRIYWIVLYTIYTTIIFIIYQCYSWDSKFIIRCLFKWYMSQSHSQT